MKNRTLFFALLLSMAASWMGSTNALAATRHYYIQAENVEWDFAPTNQDLVMCLPGPAPCAIPAPWTISHTFSKTRYIEYTGGGVMARKEGREAV